MIEVNIFIIRQKMDDWVRRHGHGAMKRLAQETGVSRTRLTAFRNGENISAATAAAIARVVEQESAYAEDERLQTVERQVTRDLAYVLATWSDGGCTLDHKIQKLDEFVRTYAGGAKLLRKGEKQQ